MIVLSLVVLIAQRSDLPLVTPVVQVVGLVLLVGIAALYVYWLTRRGPVRPRDGVLDDVSTVTMVPMTTDRLVTVDGTARHQNAIDAAQAKGGSDLTAVLTPNVTRFGGRELHTAVDLVVGSRTYRAGFIPRQTNDTIGATLAQWSLEGRYATVQAYVRGTRPSYRVDIGLVGAQQLE